MADSISKNEWSIRLGNDVDNLDLRLEELRLIGVEHGKEKDFFFTRDCIQKARQLIYIAQYSIFGLDFQECIFEEKDNDTDGEQNTGNN